MSHSDVFGEFGSIASAANTKESVPEGLPYAKVILAALLQNVVINH